MTSKLFNLFSKTHLQKSSRLCHRNLHRSAVLLGKNSVADKPGIVTTADSPPVARASLRSGPNLKDFFKDEHLRCQENLPEEQVVPYLQQSVKYGAYRKVYFDVYGCQMNVSDTEIIWSVLKSQNYLKTDNVQDADVVLIITCAIREGAEDRIWGRLDYLKGLNKARGRFRPSFKIGILGCMAERLKEKVLEKDKSVDLVAGPDSYRDLPRLLALTESDQKSVNVLLSLDETYADIMPVRLNENSVSAFV